MDFIALEALASDLHPRTKRTDGRRIFHGEPDGLRCCSEATIAEPLPRTGLTFCGNSSAGEL